MKESKKLQTRFENTLALNTLLLDSILCLYNDLVKEVMVFPEDLEENGKTDIDETLQLAELHPNFTVKARSIYNDDSIHIFSFLSLDRNTQLTILDIAIKEHHIKSDNYEQK